MAFPNLPGIPPLLAPVVASTVNVVQGSISNLLSAFSQTWGVYLPTGKAAITPDSFIDLDYVNSSRISSYPVEEGSFSSYNKVQNPRDLRVTLAKAGTQADMSDFANALESMEASLDLYTVVTPNRSYTKMNVERCDYRRELRHGAGIIIASLHFVEIRQASAAYSSAASNSLVPPSAITNSTTSLGLPSATATVASAQAIVNGGTLYPAIPAKLPAGNIF